MEVKLEENIQKVVEDLTIQITRKIQNNTTQYEEILPELNDLTALKRRLFYWLEVGEKLGVAKEKLYKISEIIAYIYLAHEIHRRVLDETVPSERKEIQYRVLMGDYMYGNFFRELAKADLLQYLAPLARIILDINEAALLGYEQQNNFRDERIFMGQSFALLGDMAGLPRDTVQELTNFGEKLGEILARLDQKDFKAEVELKSLLKNIDYLK